MKPSTTAGHDPAAPLAHPSPLSAAQRRLLGGALAAPLAWAAHLSLEYGLIYPAARHGIKAPLYAVTIVAALFSILGAVIGFGELRRLSGTPPERSAATASNRFLAHTALALGVFFTLVIVAQTVPVVLLRFED